MAYSGKFRIYCPPKFDGLNVIIWKVKITVFLNSLGSHVVKAISKLFVCLEANEDSWSEVTIKKYTVNFKAHYALLQALNDDDISRS